MKYRIEVTPHAARALRKLQRSDQLRIVGTVETLAESPRPPGAKKLTGGSGEWRVRTGNFRIIYEIRDDVLLVLVLTVGHRRDIYDNR